MTSKIEEHDYQTKLRNSRAFIENGDKVKLTMFFRGREITHIEIGQRIIQRFTEDISDVAEVEKNEGLEGNAIHLIFTQLPGGRKVKKPPLKSQPEAESVTPPEKVKEDKNA
jgi:translation initiation factor IF-3